MQFTGIANFTVTENWITVAQFTATYGESFGALFNGILRPKAIGVFELRVTLDGAVVGDGRALNIGPFLPRQDREVSIMQMLPPTTAKIVRVQARASAAGLMTLRDSRFMITP